MPEMDGVEMVRKLRKYEYEGIIDLTNTIIFALTALEEDQLGDIKALGFDYYLRKPLQWEILRTYFMK